MTRQEKSNEHAPRQDAGHSPAHLKVKGIWIAGVSLVLLLAVTFLVVSGLLNWLADSEPRPTKTDFQAVGLETGTHVELNPHQQHQRMEYEKEQEQLLNSYGWSDPDKKYAHIPIDEAMQRIVQEYQAE